MARLRTLAYAIKDRLEELPEFAGRCVVFRRDNIESEFEKRMNKTAGRAVIIRVISAKNEAQERAKSYFKAVYSVTLFTVPLLTQKDAQDADDLMAKIENRLHGWWPVTIPHNGRAQLSSVALTYPEDPTYDVSLLVLHSSLIPLAPVPAGQWESLSRPWEATTTPWNDIA